MPTSLDERIDLEDKMNIRQMFDYTPDVDDILKSCFYRPDDWNFKLMSGPDCRSFVNVSRYLTQEYMCYMFSPIITPNIRLQSVTQSMYYQFMVYQITLNPNLSKVMFVNTAIFENELPYISRDFSVLTNLIGSQHMYSGIYLSVYPATFRFIRLQRPYDTMCRNLKTDIIFQCMHKCYMQNIQEIGGKIPASQIITAKSNYKIMGAKDLRDPMMSKRMTRLTDFCEKKCFFVSCNYNYTRATVVASPSNLFGYNARSPTDPDIVTEAVALMTFVEFFSFLCGCFGIWFGASFLSVDPFRKKSRRKKKTHHSCSL